MKNSITRRSLMWVALISLFMISATTEKQWKADDIVGSWYTDGLKSRVDITKRNGKYYGKIMWLKNPLDENNKKKTDKENPDKAKRNKPLIGLEILKDFKFSNNHWHSGTIYDPDNGKTYKCKIKMPNKNRLNVRGFIGVSAVGRTTVWKRKAE